MPRRRRPISFRSNRPPGGLEEAEAAAHAEAEATAAQPADVEPAAVEPAPERGFDPWAEGAADEQADVEPAAVEPVLRPGSTAPVGAVPGTDPLSLDATAPYPTMAPRPRRRRRRWLVPLFAIVIVLLLAAGSGYGLAFLVASLANVTPPTVTLPPATPTPTPFSPEPTTASPSASPSTPSASGSPTPIPSQTIHVVQRGEYLTQIAERYGVTIEQIVEANDIENPNLIEPGQELIIPPPE